MYKLSNPNLHTLIFIILVVIIIFISYNFTDTSQNTYSMFANVNRHKPTVRWPEELGATPLPPYITQSLVINIYTTKEDYPKYEYLFKGALQRSMIVCDGTNYVLVPRTTTSIPIRVFSNAPSTKFIINANGIEQEIKETDFIATMY